MIIGTDLSSILFSWIKKIPCSYENTFFGAKWYNVNNEDATSSWMTFG